MTEYIFLMHDDAETDDAAWAPYISRLQQNGCFEGGSVIGEGICARKQGTSSPITAHLTGYIRVNAANLEQAKSLLAGNPLFEAGGTSKYVNCRGPSDLESIYASGQQRC